MNEQTNNLPTLDSQPSTEHIAPALTPEAIATATKPPKKKAFWLDFLETVVIALVIFFVVYNFVAQPHLVKGESMLPSYHDGEYILTSKLFNIWGSAQRGDVIVLKSPDDKSVQFIKRIIGLPGEQVKVSNNQVIIINDEHPEGFVLNEEYLSEQAITEGRTFMNEGSTVTVPDDSFIVMGDNRQASYDSRAWGFLKKEDLVGRAFFVYWPIVDFGLVHHARYE